jgi:hypothetical protein
MAIRVVNIGTGNVGRLALAELIENGSYRVQITGEPSYTVDICPTSSHGDHNHAAIAGAAARIINAIPAVVAAPPGIRTTLDPAVGLAGAAVRQALSPAAGFMGR